MSSHFSDSELRNSRLYKDLWHDHRDAVYRAMTFITEKGGPAPTSNTRRSLMMHRDQALNWLQTQPNLNRLLADYEDYWLRWNPVFID